jgi:pSer/pThr/pTyr-binding forkhead associated (FHA) protein
MLKLQNKDGLKPTNGVWLVEPKVVVGLSGENDLVIDGKGVEDVHAEILVQHEKLGFRLRAQSSFALINGKTVKDSRVYKLELGDVLTVGDQELQIIDPKKEFKPTSALLNREKSNSGWALKANNAALSNRVYPLLNEMIVGRSSDCDITLAVAHLSRRHAKLIVLDGLLYVKDLGSSNGTYLNGEKVTDARVKRGDEIRFDTLVFGVMGPSDDMDKTSVRSVASIEKNRSKAEVSEEKSTSREALKSRVEKQRNTLKPKIDTGVVTAKTAESSHNFWIGLVLISVIAVGAWLTLG